MSLPKNWKTTLLGVISLAGSLVQIVGDAHESLSKLFHDPSVLILLLGALGGFFAKDFNVTGGTIGQPSTLQAVLDSNHAPAIGGAAPLITTNIKNTPIVPR